MSYFSVLLIIGLLILIHEGGHFLAARRVNVPVRVFSIGFGPALWKAKKGGVEYRFSAVPLGGYVMLDLENEDDYLNLPLFKRIIFTLGGPLANIVLAFPLYAIIACHAGGLSFHSLIIAPASMILNMFGAILAALAGLFDRPEALNGIVGMVVEGGKFIGQDAVKALSMTAALSLNLAVFNLLPLPPLDGGKLILDVLHRLSDRLSKAYLPAMLCGWVAILGLMVYATVLDIGKYWG